MNLPPIKLVKKAMKRGKNGLGNIILYNLCKRYPKHNIDNVITGKTWLIGRAYMVQLERGRNKGETSAAIFYEKDVPRIFRNKKLRIDERIAELRLFRSLTKENIKKCLRVHNTLMKTLESKINLAENSTNSNKRSFCSKYLHFHLPSKFFIYDSIASRKLGLFAKLSDVSEDIVETVSDGNVDETYAKFYIKCFQLTKAIKGKYGFDLTPRQIDNLLYYCK